VKAGSVFFRAALAAAFLLTAELDTAAWPQDAGQQNEEKKTEQISEEEKEIIRHMEMLKNLSLFDNEDIEMFKALDVLTANE
jgi:hypothetical protein